VARIGDLRTQHRIGDTPIYRLLTEITLAAFTADPADVGTLPRQEAASEEREWWTVREVAKAMGRSERAVRLDCETERLPARKVSGSWLIATSDVETYAAARKRN
jgi:hypothetical protein